MTFQLDSAPAVDLATMRSHAGQAAAMLRLLGNEDRLLLLCQMVERPCTVGELEQLTGIRQPTLSQQLGVLRRQGLVETRRQGTFIWYRLADGRALQIMALVQRLFCGAAAQKGEL